MNTKKRALDFRSRLKSSGIGMACVLIGEVFAWVLVIGMFVMIVSNNPNLWGPPAVVLLLIPGCALTVLGWTKGQIRNKIYGVCLLLFLGFILWLKLGI